jgi:hypothetical protein
LQHSLQLSVCSDSRHALFEAVAEEEQQQQQQRQQQQEVNPAGTLSLNTVDVEGMQFSPASIRTLLTQLVDKVHVLTTSNQALTQSLQFLTQSHGALARAHEAQAERIASLEGLMMIDGGG